MTFIKFHILDDNEFIQELNDLINDELKDEDKIELPEVLDVISVAEAFSALDVASKWLETQKEFNKIQLSYPK